MKYSFPLIVAALLGIYCDISHAALRARQVAPPATPAPVTRPAAPPTAPATAVRPAPPAETYPKTPGSAPTAVKLPTSTPQGDFRALLVVVQNFRAKGSKSLPNAWAEMSILARELKKLGYEDITVISDQNLEESPLFPTAKNVLRQLEELVQRTQKDDTLMVIVSTHGISREGVSCFQMYDGPEVPVDSIYGILHKTPTTNKLLIAEACRESSGSGKFIAEMRRKCPKGLTVFHACSEDEKSYTDSGLDEAAPNERYSVFLHFLAKGLDEADYVVGGNNGILTVSELYNYLENQVTNYVSNNLDEDQQPETFSYDSSFVIGIRPTINPFLKMRLPMDCQLEVSLDQLAESGNIAVRETQKRLEKATLEARPYMEKTLLNLPRGIPLARRLAPEAAKTADWGVTDYGRDLIQTYWLQELDNIGKVCFSESIALRNDPKSRFFRADLYRSLGLYPQSLQDYNAANADMNLYVQLDKIAYREPPAGLKTLASRRVGERSDVIDQTVNQRILRSNLSGKAASLPPEKFLSPPPEEYLAEEFERRSSLGTLAELAKINQDGPPQVCRLIVQEIRGHGDHATWIKATVCDLGSKPFDAWFQADDVFWSKTLAENYWSAGGNPSPQYLRHHANVWANVQRIEDAVARYNYTAGRYNDIAERYNRIAAIVSWIPYAPSLPHLPTVPEIDDGMVDSAKTSGTGVFANRVSTRQGEVHVEIMKVYHSKWWNHALEQEMQTLQSR